MYKISVIVPMYNREKQIQRCLDSILLQNMEDMEILVIDDGSTDNSAKKVEEYQKRFPNRITYLYKENSGVADTRNYGIEHAKGEYILFVDSDDYIEFDLLATLKKYMYEGVELIKFKLQKVNENRRVLERINGPIFCYINGQAAFNELVFEDVLLDSPCVYIFKRSLFTKNNFEFRKNTEHEDFGLIPFVILKATTTVSIMFYGYDYVQSEESITRNSNYERTKKRFTDSLIHYDNMIEYVNQQIDLEKKTVKNIKTYYGNAIILKLRELKKEDRKEQIKAIRKRKVIRNLQVNNAKQLAKKILLTVNVGWYLKMTELVGKWMEEWRRAHGKSKYNSSSL